MATISTHVLDTALGVPARGIAVTLERVAEPTVLEREEHGAPAAPGERVGGGITDPEGRVRMLLADGQSIGTGVYRLRFDTGVYFTATRREGFYPEVVVLFRVHDGAQHYHVPLLLSPYGYSTYRGT